MDQNGLLLKIRELAARITEGQALVGDDWDLAESIGELDSWIRGGGSLPDSWNRWWQRGVTPPPGQPRVGLRPIEEVPPL